MFKKSKNIADASATLKWALLVVVLLLVVVNYFAFLEVLVKIGNFAQEYAQVHGYHFNIITPLSFFFKWLIPGIGLVGYVTTLKSGGVSNALSALNQNVTVLQLLVLLLILPILLYVQNKFFAKILLLEAKQ